MMTEFEAEVVCICGGLCTKCPYSVGGVGIAPREIGSVCELASKEAIRLRESGAIPKHMASHYSWLLSESFFTYAEGEI